MDPPQSSIDHHVRVWLTPTKYRHLRVEVEQKSLAPYVHSAVALEEQVAALAAMLPSAASALYLPHSGHHFPAASFQWRHFLLLLDRVSSSRVVCAQHEHQCSGSGSGRDLIGGMRHAHRTQAGVMQRPLAIVFPHDRPEQRHAAETTGRGCACSQAHSRPGQQSSKPGAACSSGRVRRGPIRYDDEDSWHASILFSFLTK